mmetsp:Transcript_27333/g.45705  ORF Transcript_27333/g.45705 Transcript_27333/m.45705 type:complete len:238 (+) Transcript_27333:80-793(+)
MPFFLGIRFGRGTKQAAETYEPESPSSPGILPVEQSRAERNFLGIRIGRGSKYAAENICCEPESPSSPVIVPVEQSRAERNSACLPGVVNDSPPALAPDQTTRLYASELMEKLSQHSLDRRKSSGEIRYSRSSRASRASRGSRDNCRGSVGSRGDWAPFQPQGIVAQHRDPFRISDDRGPVVSQVDRRECENVQVDWRVPRKPSVDWPAANTDPHRMISRSSLFSTAPMKTCPSESS